LAGEIAYKLTADEAQALQAVSRLSREFGLNEQAIKKAAQAAQELDRTQQQMGREGGRIFEATRTDAERYELELKRLNELYAAGKIDAETYGRAVKQAHEQNEQALRKQAEAHKSAFGEEARQSLSQYATASNLIGNSISAILERMKQLVELRKEAGQLDRSAEMAEGSLAEVASGDMEKYQKLLATSRGMAAKSGMSRQQSAALTFAAASAGAVDQMDVFGDLYGQGIVQDPEALMRATQTLQTSMGKKQTGSLRDITSKLLAAGEHSPQKIAQLGPAAALAGVNAQDAGVSADELLAAVAVESKATGDAAIAGTMQKSLQKALSMLRSAPPPEVNLEAEEKKIREKAQHEMDIAVTRSLAHLHNRPPGARTDVAREERRIREDAAANMQASLERQMLIVRSKATAGQADEEGHILDENTKQLRAQARRILPGKSGLMEELHAIQSLGLDDAQLQKLFGRQEGLMAYKLLLRNEGEFNEAKTSIGGAAGQDLVGRVLALPAGDAQASAAEALRQETSAAEVAQAASGMGARANITEAAWKRIEQEAIAGRLKGLGSGMRGEGALNLVRGEEAGNLASPLTQLAYNVRQGNLDRDPKLLKQTVEALGGEKAVFGQNLFGAQVQSPELAHYREITKDLKDAATALKNSTQRPRPTLSAPDRDR